MNPSLFFATALYALFIVYGSLVPLELKDLPLETAVSQFKNIRYLNLGAASRADWIANILLYIPLAFGAAATFSGVRYPLLRALLSVAVLVSCLALAVGVEFAQLFFPPRTVSINDLIAETLGCVVGLLGWHFSGAYLTRLYRHILHGSLLSTQAAIIFYLLFYVALSLFPFDFVASSAELDAKLAHGHDALILPFESCGLEPLRCGLKLAVEMAVLLPLGLLFRYLPYVRQPRTVAVLVGFFLGLGIETVQVFLLSGSGQGFSIVTRMVGMGVGASLLVWAKHRGLTDIMGLLRRAVWFSVLPYLFVVLAINGWFAADWSSPGQALEKLAQTRFLPLYYFYYTSEGVALVSLLSNMGMYVPIGLGCWALFFSVQHGRARPPPHWLYAGLLAALLALMVEAGKLFLPDKHADPSDIWLAFISASACYAFMNGLWRWLKRGPNPVKPVLVDAIALPLESAPTVLPAYAADKRWRAVSFMLWGVIAAALFDYPVAAIGLGLFLIGYSVLLGYFPYLWLVLVPAFLPLMDFAPWTGRFFFDEFDLLILATLAFYCWQKPKQRLSSLLSIPTRLLLAVFAMLYAVSLCRGLLPLPELNANALNNYYSHYNSLRVGKGFLWSLLLLPLLQLTVRRHRYAPHYLAVGVLLGLTGVAVFALIERVVFVGLFDFVSDYRINALFSTMHAGGGHIESYLMLSLPFITLLFTGSTHRLASRLAGTVLFVLGLYTLLVTYSRGGYIGFVVGFLVLLLALLMAHKKNHGIARQSWRVLPLLAISLAMALPILHGSMIQHRFSVADADRDSRSQHWRDALSMRDDDLTTRLLGMGLGSYPRTFFWLNSENTHPATYEIANENGNNYLRLRGGDSLFIGQYLTIEAHTPYRLALDVRAASSNLRLSTSLCEKSVQYSLRCSAVVTTINQAGWQHVEHIINSDTVGERVAQGLLQRPIQLAFYNGNGKGKLLDVDNVQLLDAAGADRLANGDFTKGGDRWYFSAEKHNPWHIFNFWVHLLFDQGWLGVSAFLLLFANAVYSLCRQLPKRAIFASVLLSSFSGFMVVGFVDSPFDAPRLTLLFFLLQFFSLLRTPLAWTNCQVHKMPVKNS